MMMKSERPNFGLMASLVLAIFVSAPATAQMDNKQAMMDLVIQVQQLQDEVRMLRGMLEDQTMDGSSSGPIVAGAAAVTTAGSYSTPPQVSPAARQDVPEVRPALDTPSSVTGLATPDTQARDVAASPEGEKAAYDQAFQSLKDLKYAAAAEQFLNFVEQYPNSEYADNAQYWLGESYYVTRNYDIALEAFQGLLSNYPDSPKVADGLLKIGYTHYELKQWDQARAALVQVQEQYPDTTLARLAGSRLRSMKLEGHY
jgi:tol-pal system protein YbgF